MIRKNQSLLNFLNVLSDGLILFCSMPFAYLIYFPILGLGDKGVPIKEYLFLAPVLALVALFTFATFGLYRSLRRVRAIKELGALFIALAIDMLLLLSALFLGWMVNFSRGTLFTFFVVSFILLSLKRLVLRLILRRWREKGFNQKHILIVGDSFEARRFIDEINCERWLGYKGIGIISQKPWSEESLPYLGDYSTLGDILESMKPDEVVCAISPEDYSFLPEIIILCENNGIKFSLIPFYSEYMSGTPQFDMLNDIPLLNLRRIPLDNWLNAFIKRAVDVFCSGLGLLVLSPFLLLCAIGVKLSSPGPIIFSQPRVGLNKKVFNMYKFRSMKVNSTENSAWSASTDSRRTPFGSFIRKCSIDELPQLFNVLVGDMSLVGPRPEIPHFVEQFRKEIPLYMVKHQVRPGITGWAQVNGLRGDTSIKKRIEHDIFYIEHWSIWFDIKILFMTVFGGKFINDERLH